MDLVDWDEARFREIEARLRGAGRAARRPARARPSPISALHGDNVVERGGADWYDGPPLLEHLEEVDVASDRGAGPLRLPVQWVIRPEDGGRGASAATPARWPAARCARATRSWSSPPARARASRRSSSSTGRWRAPPRRTRSPSRSPTTSTWAAATSSAGVERAAGRGREIEATLCWMAETPAARRRHAHAQAHDAHHAGDGRLDRRACSTSRRSTASTRPTSSSSTTSRA